MSIEERRYGELWIRKLYAAEPWVPCANGAYGRCERVLDAMQCGELPNRGDLYLDIGAGRGDLLAEVGRRFAFKECVGLEIADEACWRAEDLSRDVRKTDLREAPWVSLGDETVDVATCLDVIEHVYPFDAILSEAYRVLKQGGKFWLSTPNLCYQGYCMSIVRGYVPRTSGDGDDPLPFGGHVTPGFTYYTLETMLRGVGFTTSRFGMPLDPAGVQVPWLAEQLKAAHPDVSTRWIEWDLLNCDTIIVGRKP